MPRRHYPDRQLLDHVGREHARAPVAAFIFIGDTVEEDGETLVATASRLGVRCFVFHESPDENFRAVAVLRAIATRSGGIYLPFDAASADRFRELLAGIAAFAAGGRAALENRNDAGSRLLLSKL